MIGEGAFILRAECMTDFGRLLCLISANMVVIHMFENGPQMSLVEPCDENGLLSLDKLREILRTIVDGHVMVETVNHARQYTGERKYGA